MCAFCIGISLLSCSSLHIFTCIKWVLRWCSLTRLAERKAAVQPTGFSVDKEDAQNTHSDEERQENDRSYGQTYESTDTEKGEKGKKQINEQSI